MPRPSERLSDFSEVGRRVDELRVARGVRLDELAAAIDLPARSLQLRMRGVLAFSEGELGSLACALEAPPGWPEHEPAELPTGRIALSAPSHPRAALDQAATPLPPRKPESP